MRPFTTYIIGYALSITFTLVAFGLLAMHMKGGAFPSTLLITLMLVVLALMQLGVQLYFFLHLGHGNDRRVNGLALLFAVFVAIVLVGGTLWILSNVTHHATGRSPFIDNMITAQNEND